MGSRFEPGVSVYLVNRDVEMNSRINRRLFIGTSASVVASAVVRPFAADSNASNETVRPSVVPQADSMILIWLPGGIAHADMWDPKTHTPFRAGMKGEELLSTCGPIPTTANGVFLGKGLDHLASVMDKGTVLRTLVGGGRLESDHLLAQYRMITGYEFPAPAKAPSIGAMIARVLGPKDPEMPPYIYIGRDSSSRDPEEHFIHEYLGGGFYGPAYAPLMLSDTVEAGSIFGSGSESDIARMDRRLNYLMKANSLGAAKRTSSAKTAAYMNSLTQARALMNSPLREALEFSSNATLAAVNAYEPEILQSGVTDKTYYHGARFGRGLLLARRLIERGARFIQVEYPFARQKGFDTHENGGSGIQEMKKQIDRPIAQLIRDLDQTGLLERTLVVVATEFGRTVGNTSAVPGHAEDFLEDRQLESLVISEPKMYGFHRHFDACNSMLFFGGGFKKGYVHGKTAELHPMVPVENPAVLRDVHATILKSLGIPADTSFKVNGHQFYATEDGRGRAIDALLG